MSKVKTPWYDKGLHFECQGCGNCCAGPEPGFIWITKHEIDLLADYMKVTPAQLFKTHLARIGDRVTILEDPFTNDCRFLLEVAGKRGCVIYPVRPNQCRTWPFWTENVSTSGKWKYTAGKCPGIDRGKHHHFEEIEKIRKQTKWWEAPSNNNNQLVEQVADIYQWLDAQIHKKLNTDDSCRACGKCCDFEKYDHRLFVTSPELTYFAVKQGDIKRMDSGVCPYNSKGKCTAYEYRFAGCRIFNCRADKDFQSELSESVLKKFKSLCQDFQIPYRYTDLATALNDAALR